jgi:hypothetical protein
VPGVVEAKRAGVTAFVALVETVAAESVGFVVSAFAVTSGAVVV